MSDERDGAGSASTGTGADGDGDERDRRAQTAVAARPLRPTGKRARRGAVDDGDAAETGAETETKDSGSKNGAGTKAKTARDAESGKGWNAPFLFVVNYLKQVVAELKKVIWPNRKQMVSYTTVVLAFLAFMVAMIAGADRGLAYVVGLVFGN